MTRRTKIWIIAGAVLLAYIIVAIVAGHMLGVTGRDAWALRGGLTLLGVISAALILWFFRDRTPAGPPTAEARLAAEVEQVLIAARQQLAAAKSGDTRDARFAKLPVVLVLGPEGSTKTTAVVRSGLEPELLAGEATRGDTVAPTKTVNVWFAQGTVFAEAGSAVLNAANNWRRFVRSLRPRSLVAALTGKPQAPRMAVVCFGCDELLKPGGGERVAAAAQSLRERLGEAATELGVQLPTYVLFTKADTIPHFEAFVRNFSADEAREPLGASLAPDSGTDGTYTERVTPRLELAMHDIYRSLAARRLPVLAREHAAEWKPPAYEFPREMRKLAPLVVEFLREIGKPSALKGSPLLRGFYFIGVQPVLVNETAPEYAPAMQQARAVATARSATGVFTMDQVAAAAAAATPPAGPRTRRIPRWDFLPRLFREVVLADDAAARLTQGGERVGFLRRATLAGGAALALLLSMAFAISYSGNRQLQRQVGDATRGIAAIAPNNVDFPPVDALRKLDTLRAQIETLSAYDHHGAPLSLRWGLYSGSGIYPEVRRAYFAGFNRLMFANAKVALLASLRSLPDSAKPTDDYGATYSLLKAYLITTTHPEKSSVEFLSPVLMKQWVGGRALDPERTQLAQRQFDTYARELQYWNPFPERADEPAVARGRSFLRQYAGSLRIYQYMLAEANKASEPVQFNRKFPGSAQFIVDSYEVPGAFTKSGYAYMQNAFKTVDRFLQGENWVVGEDAQPVDKAKIVAELRSRYATDYVENWRQFLRTASIARYTNVRDAAQKLTVLSGNQSPLLSLFSVAARNTSVPSSDISGVFQPVQVVTPPADTAKLIGQGNQAYMSALVAFQAAVAQAAAAAGQAGESAAGQALGSAAAAKSAAVQIAASFTIDQQGQVQSTVQKLMEDPISYAEALLTRFGADQINARIRSFCGAVRPTFTKFPFNPSSPVQASIPEVAAILRPGSGSLWTMYNDVLQTVLQKQSTVYQPVGGNVRLSPAFVDFFNKAATFSDLLFAGGTPDPHYSITVKPQLTEGTSAVAIQLEGDVVRSSRNLQSQRVDWPSVNHEARLSATLGTAEVNLVGPLNSPWALFQLFYAADSWLQVGTAARAEWTLRTGTQGISLPSGAALKVSVDVTPAASAVVLRRGYFAAMDCSGEAAR